jgi:thymidylate kinase
MESKPKLIIFEGPDKSGKSTLFQMYRRATKYSPLAIERFTGSNYVYDKHYRRSSNLDLYLNKEEEVQAIFDCYLILLLAPVEVLRERIMAQEVGEAKDIALENFEEIVNLFVDYYTFDTRYKKKKLVFTDRVSPETALQIILAVTGERRS